MRCSAGMSSSTGVPSAGSHRSHPMRRNGAWTASTATRRHARFDRVRWSTGYPASGQVTPGPGIRDEPDLVETP
jgi:hypothetical protein